MKIKSLLALLLFIVEATAWGQSNSSAFSLTDRSSSSLTTDGGGLLSVGYARILPDSGGTAPAGVAIFGFRTNNVLVSEAGVPSSPLLTGGRVYAEVNGGLDIGIAVANPSAQPAEVSFYFTSVDGTDFGAGSFTLPAGQQIARFLDQSPFNSGQGIQGTFTFSSNIPISVITLQGFTNERGEFLITTLPVVDTSIAAGSGKILMPHFAVGAGWATSVLLVNPTGNPLSGTIEFRDPDGALAPLTANGQSSSSFAYSVAQRSSFKLTTAGDAANLSSGSVSIIPDSGSSAPVPLVVFSYKPGAFTVTQAGVPANSGTAFRMYVEASGPAAGSISTGVAVANDSPAAATVTFDLYTADGAATGFTNALSIAGAGQMAKFVNEIFPAAPVPFQGVLRIRTSSPAISVVGLRGRYNERGDFLITTTPPMDEAAATTTAESDFPHIVNGGGYTTQFILFSGASGQSTAGNLRFFGQDGGMLLLSLAPAVPGGAPFTLSSISPSRAARGSTLTLTGSGFDAYPPGNMVVFASVGGTVSAAAIGGSSTSLLASVPDAAVSGPVFVQTSGRSSSARILEVIASETQMLQNPITVATASTTSGVDIYVPPPAIGLSVTQVGIGEVNGPAYGGILSVEVNRGQTKDLVVVGSGLASTAGINVAISGSDVAVSNLRYSSGVVRVTIAIGLNAEPGPRNVIVTNAVLDMSVMTGGLSIR